MKKLCVTAIALMFMFGLGFGSNSALAEEVLDETEVSNEAPADCGAYQEESPTEELNCGNPGEKPEALIEAGENGFCDVEGWSSNGPFTMCFPTPDGDLDGWYDGEGNLVASASGETDSAEEADLTASPTDNTEQSIESPEEVASSRDFDEPVGTSSESIEEAAESSAQLNEPAPQIGQCPDNYSVSNVSCVEAGNEGGTDTSATAGDPAVTADSPASINFSDPVLSDGTGAAPVDDLSTLPGTPSTTLSDGTVVNALPATGVGPGPQSSLTEGQREFLIAFVSILLILAITAAAIAAWAHHTASRSPSDDYR